MRSPEESSFEAQFDQIRMQNVWQPHTVWLPGHALLSEDRPSGASYRRE